MSVSEHPSPASEPPVDLCVFDMAGTTIDDGGEVYRALRSCVEETGASVAAEDLQAWMGADKVTAITELMRAGGQEPAPERVRAAFDRFREILAESYRQDPPRPLEGVEQTLRLLHEHGIRVALTTGFDRRVAGPLLEALGWASLAQDGSLTAGAVVDTVVTTDDVAQGRPAPYMIHRAMERTGVLDVHRVLAAGDTAVDLRAGHHAGGLSVGVLTGGADRTTLEAEPHDAVLDGVRDVPGWLGLPTR